MKNNLCLDHLNKEDREEYLEIINELKQEFKNKIQNEIAKVRSELAKNTAEVLGVEFANLLNERKELLKIFKNAGKRLLTYAKECGLTTELEKLQNWSTQSKKEEKAKPEGTKLFDDVVKSVANKNPSLANEVSEIQLQINKNSEMLVQIVKSKKSLIDKAQQDFRAPLQKVIVDLLVEFNKKVLVVNQSFNIENKKPISPFDEGDKLAIEGELSSQITNTVNDDFEDEFFIPTSLSDDELN